MAARFEDQPWHQEWREVLDRVIATEMARDRAKPGTPEREAADREYEAALVVFRALAEKSDHGPHERTTVNAVGMWRGSVMATATYRVATAERLARR